MQSGPNTYELLNPCTGWSVVFARVELKARGISIASTSETLALSLVINKIKNANGTSVSLVPTILKASGLSYRRKLHLCQRIGTAVYVMTRFVYQPCLYRILMNVIYRSLHTIG